MAVQQFVKQEEEERTREGKRMKKRKRCHKSESSHLACTIIKTYLSVRMRSIVSHLPSVEKDPLALTREARSSLDGCPRSNSTSPDPTRIALTNEHTWTEGKAGRRL